MDTMDTISFDDQDISEAIWGKCYIENHCCILVHFFLGRQTLIPTLVPAQSLNSHKRSSPQTNQKQCFSLWKFDRSFHSFP